MIGGEVEWGGGSGWLGGRGWWEWMVGWVVELNGLVGVSG